ncbi:MAG TPA: hypothetical protein VFZ66_06255 [Herpetosiphonaceae bacterium]
MNTILTNLRSSAIIGAILVLPFLILELVNRSGFHEAFPIMLFGILWLLPVGVMLLLTPIVNNLRAGKSIMVNPRSLVLRGACVILLTWLWGSILLDQLPCFLGVPNCD